MALSRIYPEARAQEAKVFWFFFSKKNCFRLHIVRRKRRKLLRTALMHLRLLLEFFWKPRASGLHQRLLGLAFVPLPRRQDRRVPTALKLCTLLRQNTLPCAVTTSGSVARIALGRCGVRRDFSMQMIAASALRPASPKSDAGYLLP